MSKVSAFIRKKPTQIQFSGKIEASSDKTSSWGTWK